MLNTDQYRQRIYTLGSKYAARFSYADCQAYAFECMYSLMDNKSYPDYRRYKLVRNADSDKAQYLKAEQIKRGLLNAIA